MNERKVGVLICDCGGELARIIDFDSLVSWIKSLEEVGFVRRHSHLCGDKGKEMVLQTLREGTDRIVIAACSPKVIEYTFRKMVEETSLNPYLLEIANIREQCAWAHRDDVKGANIKAKGLTSAAVRRAFSLREIERKTFEVNKSVLVIGGGIAGIQAAMDIADFGFRVHLVEKEPIIGGNALKLGLAFPTDDGAFCISSPSYLEGVRKCFYRSGILSSPNLQIHTLTEVIDFGGTSGNFRADLRIKPRGVKQELCINCGRCSIICPIEVYDPKHLGPNPRKAIYLPHPNAVPPSFVIDWDHCNSCGGCVEACPTNAISLDREEERLSLDVGSVVVATGFQEYDPSKIRQYRYGADKDVITQLELARLLDPYGPTGGVLLKPSDGETPRKIVMIQCVGSRDEKTNPYCSKICCTFTLKHAIEIKKRYGDEIEVYICYMDVRTVGKGYEEYYSKAREEGVAFIRGRPSKIYRDPSSRELKIVVEDTMENRTLELGADLTVLSVALVSTSGTEKLAKLLGIEIGKDGFVKEIYSKLKPTETGVKGIYVCGGVQGPKDIPESITQARAASFRAILDLSKNHRMKYLDTASLDEELCDGCEVCVEVCPYSAIEMQMKEEGDGNSQAIAFIDEVKCERCGLCMGRCPTGAIQLRRYEDETVLSQAERLLMNGCEGSLHPKIITFCCDECGYSTLDLAGMAGMTYPSSILPVRVPCLGWVSLYQIFKTFELGADGLLLVGCNIENCQYKDGAKNAKEVVEFAKGILDEIGLGASRVRMVDVCAAEPNKFIKEAEEMTGVLSKLEPLRKALRGVSRYA